MENFQQKQDKIFILGSGFSKDLINLDTLIDIDIEHLIEKCSSEIKPFLHKTPALLKRKGEFENFLSYLAFDHPWSSSKDYHLRRAAYLEISENFSKRLKSKIKESKEEQKLSFLKDLIRYWHEFENTVITFNYDTLVENEFIGLVYSKNKYDLVSYPFYFTRTWQSKDGKAFIKAIDYSEKKRSYKNFFEFNFPAGFTKKIESSEVKEWLIEIENEVSDQEVRGLIHKIYSNPNTSDIREIANKLNTTISFSSYLYQILLPPLRSRTGFGVFGGEQEKTFRYYKLHGSLNWYYSGLSEIQNETIYCHPLKEDPEPDLVNGFTPVIIPPVLDKNSFYRNHSIRLQWQKAVDALSNESVQEIYFIGYSFPMTDILVRQAFQKAVGDRRLKIYLLSLFENVEQIRLLLKNYAKALTPLSDKEIEEKLPTEDGESLNLKLKEYEFDHILFDLRFSIYDPKSQSTVEKLVEHLSPKNDGS